MNHLMESGQRDLVENIQKTLEQVEAMKNKL
jgi:hypothetical protein